MTSNFPYLLIDSRDRINQDDEVYDFNIQLTPSLSSIKGIKLLSLSIPLTQFTVNDDNNKIYFSDGFGSYVATVTNGIYDSDTIQSAITTAMNATGYSGTISVTYDTITYLFTLSGTSAFSLDFATDTNSIAYHLGYDNINTGLATDHIATRVAHLSIPEFFFVNLDVLPQKYITSNNDRGTFIIFTDVISGSIQHFNENTNYYSSADGGIQQLQFFRVWLTRRGGVPMMIRNNWSMLLEIQYY